MDRRQPTSIHGFESGAEKTRPGVSSDPRAGLKILLFWFLHLLRVLISDSLGGGRKVNSELGVRGMAHLRELESDECFHLGTSTF